MGTLAKRPSFDTTTSWPFTPTTIFASSRRLSGSITRTVCSIWFATTSSPRAEGAEFASLNGDDVIRIAEAVSNEMRGSTGHLDRIPLSFECREAHGVYPHGNSTARRTFSLWRFFAPRLAPGELRSDGPGAGQGFTDLLWKSGDNQVIRLTEQAGEFIARHGVTGFLSDLFCAGQIGGGDDVEALGQF